MERLKGKGIITLLQKRLLHDMAGVADSSHFYLTGGTALAEFFFGHRRSYDLDIFTTEAGLADPFSRTLEERLGQPGDYSVKALRRFESFVELEAEGLGERVQIHIAYDSPFRFGSPLQSEYGVDVNDYRDLIVDKVLAFFGRWLQRDAVDLFHIMQKESIMPLLDKAKQKDPGFDLYWFAAALAQVETYPDDMEKWPVDMLVNIDAGALKRTFLDLSREIMEKIRNGKN
ncbi:MAG: nucleotidyl transferase AbiEii/AbiGii toxin family protein [Thermodesulfobacteriota bacterium]